MSGFDLGADVYRRAITVRQLDARSVRCELHDDFHHFVVVVEHDASHVTAVHAESHRWPWETCPAAGGELAALSGMPLTDRFTAASRWADANRNCTHQFDAAAHAITHAFHTHHGTRATVRRYDCEIGAHMARSATTDAPGRNRLWVDGAIAHDWLVAAGRGLVDGPSMLRDAPWKGGFMRWADEHLEPDTAEIAIVLRRACDIGMGRGMDLDAVPHAGELLGIMSGVCYSMQPDIAPGSRRNVGAIRDYAADPSALAEQRGEGT